MESIKYTNLHAETSGSLNLTDINDDCKTLIFKHLEWKDLISVAETSKQLYKAACDVYKQKYGKGRLSVLHRRIIRSATEPDLYLWHALDSLKILRNFGHVVSHIMLSYDYRLSSCRFVFHIENYIAKYCSKSLKQLSLDFKPIYLFKEIGKLFVNIEHIHLNCFYYPIHELSLDSIFPNLNSVRLEFYEFNFMPISIPSMKKLSIFYIGKNKQDTEIGRFLEINPQLEDLNLHLYYSFSDTLSQRLSENLPMLKRLSLRMKLTQNVERYNLINVIEFRLRPINHAFPYIPFTFTKLERFECECYLEDPMNSRIFDFIAENSQLKSITISGAYDQFIDRLFQLNSVLSTVEELNIRAMSTFPISISDRIFDLFSQNQSLKKLTLTGKSIFTKWLNDFVKSKICKREKTQYGLKLTLCPHMV
ncbi:uncharacterized protein LOC116351603 [Contarinia nasturtii]|uniref:uncharacterized protein LOC116351603 n=1 Tax=Contarinia nasturtii TaxID=265458 RepID=UPI0012D3D36F|nr:uncharacterized protein LOC116351603 [Contarinia nasturtii]